MRPASASFWLTAAMLTWWSPRTLGDLGEDAGLVGDLHPEIVAGFELLQPEDRDIAFRAPVLAFACAEDDGVGEVEQVRDDGRAGGFGARATALEEDGAGEVADDLDGVVDAIDFGERFGERDERRGDAGDDPAVGTFGDGEELDDVAEFARVLEVACRKARDAFGMRSRPDGRVSGIRGWP